MRSRVRDVLIAAIAAGVGAIVAATALPLEGQAPAGRGQAPAAPAGSAPAAYRAPRLADNHPDLNGIWQALNEANYDLEAHMARAALQLRPGPYGPVPAAAVVALGAVGSVPPGIGIIDGDGTIPYKPEALKQKKENQDKYLERDPEVKCYLPGVPRASYMGFPFQIIQSQKHVMLVHEYAGAVRTVYMTDQVEAPADSWMGWSNGRWEGESLVVDTKGFNDLSWFDRAGNFHSDALHVVERFTPRSPDTLNYEVTVEDSKVFTRPWKMSMPLYRRVEANAQILEFRCVEFVEDLLYGHLRKQPSQ